MQLLKLLNTNRGRVCALLAIVILFLFSRLVSLGAIPPNAYWDEASIGYNAFSMTHDLKDEWGEFLPLHFRAFGEFKLPVYVYAVVPTVKIFGLNTFAVRLPAVIFSLLSVLLVFVLALKLKGNYFIALLSAFYLVVSPWFFLFSRTGHEATAGVFFMTLGLVLFFYRDRKLFHLFSTLSYILAIYSYNSMRIIIPVILFFEAVYLIKLKQNLRMFFFCLFLFIIAHVPIVRLFYLDFGGTRLSAVGEKGVLNIVSNYISHFSPNFLLSYDAPRSVVPTGVVFPFDIFLVMFGVVYALKNINSKVILLILGFLVCLIPSAITKEAPHALRALSSVVFLGILWALGVHALTHYFKNRLIIVVTTVIITLVFFVKLFSDFVLFYNISKSQDWQYGYKKLFSDYQDSFKEYDKVIISDSYSQPYIFWLFYSSYTPKDFRSKVHYNNPSHWGISTVASLDNMEFREPTLADFKKGNLIFATKEFDGSHSEITFLNGDRAFYVYRP